MGRVRAGLAVAVWSSIALAACASSGPATSPGPAASPAVSSPATPSTAAAGPVLLKAEVWADNWFALWVDGRKVGEDSVPITTERSFNAETFTFEATYPFEMNLMVKDYEQDDSGLEYIGTPRQQMGDGGLIAQITEVATGKVVAVTDARCRCLVLQKAPLDKGCVKDPVPSATCGSRSVPEPDGWRRAGFDTSGWEAATEYTEAEVGPKDGYLTIRWDRSARLVWTSDLLADNILVCKRTVTGA